MKYPFPVIKNIKQAREAIGDSKEFILSEKEGGYTVGNYLVVMPDTFPEIKLNAQGDFDTKQDYLNAVRRELRGIKFDTVTGNVIARPFHKFFNANERVETQLTSVFANGAIGDNTHYILDKLDGSMIHPIPTPLGIHWCTKMGITDVARPVETFVNEHPQYLVLAKECIESQLTPIFEWCSRKQRIVIDYPEDRLVLIAIRDNYTGQYLPLEQIENIVNGVDIEMVMPLSVDDIAQPGQDFIEAVREKKGLEGYVLRFHTGHMLKLKAEEYLKIHKAKDGLSFEKNVIDLIVNDKLDDVKPFLQDSDLQHVTEFEADFWKGFNFFVDALNAKYLMGKLKAGDDKKVFAVEFVNKEPAKYKAFLFHMWADLNARDVVLTHVRKNLGTQAQVDEMRFIFGANWNPTQVGE